MAAAGFGALLLLLAAPCAGQRHGEPGGWEGARGGERKGREGGKEGGLCVKGRKYCSILRVLSRHGLACLTGVVLCRFLCVSQCDSFSFFLFFPFLSPPFPVFQPSFIHMSGLTVNSFFLGDSSGVSFSIIVDAIDKETGKNILFTCYFEKK